MSDHFAPFVLLLTLLAPALLALLTVWRAARVWGVRLAPLAFLPAIATALQQPVAIQIDALLLGTNLALDSTGRIFLLLSGVAWATAAMFARAWLADDPARWRFVGFFLGAATGNLGVCIAADIVSFYFLFALMTFSAWGMVLHRRTPQARRAGYIYVALAVLGEAALLLAFLLIAASGTTLIAEVPAAVATSPARNAIVALLLIGFGVKTGVLGLHMALPLAYSATPAPGAAALASAMISAGVLGWLRFLPLGYEQIEWSFVFVGLGMAAAFFGVGVGLLQREPKTILAYSSVSQLGLIMVGIGAALAVTGTRDAAIAAVTVYTLHHAFAKGALFLGEAVARSMSARGWALVGLALPAVALAGAPFSSGAVAKHLLVDSVGQLPWASALSYALTAAALGTTLLMARFLWRVWHQPDRVRGVAASPLIVPWGVALAAVIGTGLLLQQPNTSFSSFVAAVWPILLGAAVAVGAVRLVRTAPTIAPGDILEPIVRVLDAACHIDLPRFRVSKWRVTWPVGAVERIERTLRSWSVVGLSLFLLLGLLLLLFAA